MVVVDHVERFVAVGRGQQLDAIVLELLERLLDEQPDVLLVVDDEDGGHRGSPLGGSKPRSGGGGPYHDAAKQRARCKPCRLAQRRRPTVRHHSAVPSDEIRPMRSLGLLSVAHAINHAQAVLLPLIFLAIIDEFGVGVETDRLPGRVRRVRLGARPAELRGPDPGRVRGVACSGIGGILFGGGFALQAFATSFVTFAVPNIVSRIGGSPQHPVGNGLLAEQFPAERRGFAISAHIAGGNVGTVVVAVVGVPLIARSAGAAPRSSSACRRSSSRSRSCCSSGSAARTVPPPWRAAPSAPRSGGSCADPDLRWLYLTSVLGGGGRGLGVVNLFALIYLTCVIGLDEATAGLMYGALIVFSVPMPLRRRLAVRPDRPQAAHRRGLSRRGARVRRVPAGRARRWCGCGSGIVLMGLFSFAESPQLQALLGDISPPSTRDASYALYFTLAFGVGSLWVALYGVIIEAAGEAAGLPIVFLLMAVSFVLAALATLPIHAEQRARENAAYEAGL